MTIITGGNVISGGSVLIDSGDGQILTLDGAPVDDVDNVASQGTLTIAEPVTDGDEFTLDAKVYTLQDTLTDVDGNIEIGISEATTKANIVAAINLTGTPGTDYALSMTIHPTITATAFATDAGVLTAKVAGVAGDSIVTVESGQGFTHISNVFDAGTLGTTTAGVDNVNGSFDNKVIAGGLVKDNATGNVYENDGTQTSPTYTRIDTV